MINEKSSCGIKCLDVCEGALTCNGKCVLRQKLLGAWGDCINATHHLTKCKDFFESAAITDNEMMMEPLKLVQWEPISHAGVKAKVTDKTIIGACISLQMS